MLLFLHGMTRTSADVLVLRRRFFTGRVTVRLLIVVASGPVVVEAGFLLRRHVEHTLRLCLGQKTLLLGDRGVVRLRRFVFDNLVVRLRMVLEEKTELTFTV